MNKKTDIITTKMTGLKKRPTIGIIVDWITSQYQVGLVSGISDVAQAHGASIICFEGGVLSSPREYETQRNKLYNLVSDKNVDGMVFLAGSVGHYVDNDWLKTFLDRYKKIPVVSISRDIEGIASILIDNRSGMRALLNHLIHDHGYRRIALVRGHADSYDAQERYGTYLEALEENGIPFDPAIVAEGLFNAESGITAIETILDERKSSFEAIVALNDDMAMGIIRELRRREINIPMDVAVVGFDNIDLTRFSSPPLTTVSQPIYEMGKIAANLLFDIRDGKDVPRKTEIHTGLVIRESCGCSSYTNKKSVYSVNGNRNNDFAAFYSEIREALAKEIYEIIKKIRGEFGNEDFSSSCNKLVSALYESIAAEKPEFFINTWGELLYNLLTVDFDAFLCDEILSVFRNRVLPFIIDSRMLLFTVDLYNYAQGVIGRKALQSEKFYHLKKEADNFRLNILRDDLLVISDVKRLTDVLATGFLPLGLENAYLALYKGERPSKKSRAKLLLAFKDKKRIKIAEQKQYYEPEKIIPDEFRDDQRRTVIVVEPLIHTSEFLGFIVLDFLLPKYFIYEELRRTISRALHGALLFEEVQSRTRALRENERSLRAITEAIPTPLVIIRAKDGGILYANLPFYTVFKTTPIKDGIAFIHEYSGNKSAFESLVKRLETEKKLSDIELPMRRSDGTQFWVIASFQVLSFREEKCFIAGFYDITERLRLEKEVLDISGREQKRIGQELHDDICQDLVGISTLIQAIANKLGDYDSSIAERAGYIAELVNKTNEKTQRLAHGLFPQELDEKGFAVMLRELAARIEIQFSLSCTCSFSILDKITDNTTILHLYRIAQEAVNNAVKHGKPKKIRISFVSDDKHIELGITDDGIGIPENISDTKGIGLYSMRYRATVIGGRLDIRRKGAHGTRVACIIEKSVPESG
jgi:DNA-binding LacI/PurR family transcriptional regulator/signal transduction histidine kinase